MRLPSFLGPYLSSYFHIEIGEPRIAAIRETILLHSVGDDWLTRALRQARSWLGLVSQVLFAVFLATEGLASGHKALATTLWSVVSAAFAMTALGFSALTALERGTRSLFQRAWGSLFTATASLLIIAALVATAYWLGLVDAWIRLGEGLGPGH